VKCNHGTCVNGDKKVHSDGYFCKCESGWETSKTRLCDQNVNECQLNTHKCSVKSTCKDTPGSYECVCDAGYRLQKNNKFACVEIDECKENKDSCHANAVCTNTPGAYKCDCKPGYSGDGSSCVEIDECKEGTDECDENAKCDNTVGGYTCTCNSGYRDFRNIGHDCDDINECEDGTNNCAKDATCTNIGGGFKCNCKAGFRGDGEVCKDIDECKENSFKCHAHSSCKNRAGGYDCVCNDGYYAFNKGCRKNDECEEKPCANGAKCIDQVGSFKCECAQGWSGKLCTEDIDECKANTFTCPDHSTCQNMNGTYTCACKDGYEGNAKKCTKIDFCESKPCLNNGVCRDQVNGFKCICAYPFSGETCDTKDTTTTAVNVNVDKQDDDQQEESAASKEGKQQGTTYAVAGGVGIFVVIVIIGAVVGIILLRRKKSTVAPQTPHIQNTEVPDKIKPSFVKEDAIELTQVTPITQADAEVVVTADAEVVTEAKVIEAPEAPKSRTEHVGEGNDASLTLGQRVSAHGYQSGVIMYIGELNSMPSMKGVTYIGIKLDKPEGSGNGTVNGVRYFECDPFCSVFVTPHAVKPVE